MVHALTLLELKKAEGKIQASLLREWRRPEFPGGGMAFEKDFALSLGSLKGMQSFPLTDH